MASLSHNLESSWNYRPIFADTKIFESFSSDTDTLTKALQHTLSDYSDNLNTDDALFPKPQTTASPHTQSGSGSDPETPAPRRKGVVAAGKIAKSKRKSRATKRSTTTFINADPANFRQMVQQVTGVSFLNGQLPVAPLVKPEQQVVGPASGHMNFVAPEAVADGGPGFDLESLVASFPTLDSWKVM